MKRLFSTKYSAGAFNIGMLILRGGMAALMIPHGFDKLQHFPKYSRDFMNFLGTGQTVSLALLVFAEFFCACLVLLGLFTRLACIPLIIAMSVALVQAHKSQVFGEGEHATLFIIGFLTVLILGPGKISVDGAMGK
jgi:putative oxidoreductase